MSGHRNRIAISVFWHPHTKPRWQQKFPSPDTIAGQSGNAQDAPPVVPPESVPQPLEMFEDKKVKFIRRECTLYNYYMIYDGDDPALCAQLLSARKELTEPKLQKGRITLHLDYAKDHFKISVVSQMTSQLTGRPTV